MLLARAEEECHCSDGGDGVEGEDDAEGGEVAAREQPGAYEGGGEGDGGEGGGGEGGVGDYL